MRWSLTVKGRTWSTVTLPQHSLHSCKQRPGISGACPQVLNSVTVAQSSTRASSPKKGQRFTHHSRSFQIKLEERQQQSLTHGSLLPRHQALLQKHVDHRTTGATGPKGDVGHRLQDHRDRKTAARCLWPGGRQGVQLFHFFFLSPFLCLTFKCNSPVSF